MTGIILGDRFELREPLGKGGMAEVYRARDLRLGRDVAIKLLNATCSRDPSIVERFRKESAALAQLNNPRIVTLLDTGETPDGRFYLVMERLRGEALDLVFRTLKAREVRMPWRRLASIVRQVCLALHAAHGQGIVHRDIKPSNLFRLDDVHDGEDFIKILDFGIAKILATAEAGLGEDRVQLTASGIFIGTPHYAAPEAIEPHFFGGLGAHTDVFSLGVILYQAAAGVLPHEGEPRSRVLYKTAFEEPPPLRERAKWPVPESIEAVVLRAIAREPGARYASARELSEALARVSPEDARAFDLAAVRRVAEVAARAQVEERRRGVLWSPSGLATLSQGAEARADSGRSGGRVGSAVRVEDAARVADGGGASLGARAGDGASAAEKAAAARVGGSARPGGGEVGSEGEAEVGGVKVWGAAGPVAAVGRSGERAREAEGEPSRSAVPAEGSAVRAVEAAPAGSAVAGSGGRAVGGRAAGAGDVRAVGVRAVGEAGVGSGGRAGEAGAGSGVRAAGAGEAAVRSGVRPEEAGAGRAVGAGEVRAVGGEVGIGGRAVGGGEAGAGSGVRAGEATTGSVVRPGVREAAAGEVARKVAGLGQVAGSGRVGQVAGVGESVGSHPVVDMRHGAAGLGPRWGAPGDTGIGDEDVTARAPVDGGRVAPPGARSVGLAGAAEAPPSAGEVRAPLAEVAASEGDGGPRPVALQKGLLGSVGESRGTRRGKVWGAHGSVAPEEGAAKVAVVEAPAEGFTRNVTTRAPGRVVAVGPVVGARAQAGDTADPRGSHAVAGEIVEDRRGIVSSSSTRRSGSGPLLAAGESSTVVERERIPVGVVVAAAVLIGIIAAAWLGMPPPPPLRSSKSSVEELRVEPEEPVAVAGGAGGSGGAAGVPAGSGQVDEPGGPGGPGSASAAGQGGSLDSRNVGTGAGQPAASEGGQAPGPTGAVEPEVPTSLPALGRPAGGTSSSDTAPKDARASVERRLKKAAEQAVADFKACARKTVLLGEVGYGMSVVLSVEAEGLPSSAAAVRATERKLPSKLALRELPSSGKVCMLERLRGIRIAAPVAAEITHTYQMQ